MFLKTGLTVGQHVERLAVGVHGGETGGLRRDGAPPLQGRLQRRGPVGYDAQLLALHGHHLGPLRLGLVGVWLLDCRRRIEEESEKVNEHVVSM